MPVLTVFAGPNGSGKSTLTQMLIERQVELGNYLNADDIAREMKGDLAEVSARAQQIVRDARMAALGAGRDHAFETVMSHPSHIDYMRGAAAAGFEVRLFFVATGDPSVNLGRVANRVRHGGHDVPTDKVIGRYRRCLENLPAAINAAHLSQIFDNSSVKRPMRPLARINRANGRALLVHGDIAAKGWWAVEADDIPVWWLEILLQLSPDDPFNKAGLLPE